MIYILNDTTEDCTNKYFPSVEYRFVYDIIFTNMENKEEIIILTITLEYMRFKSQLFGLDKEIKTALKLGFGFSETVKLTIEIDSSLSNINKCY